MPSQLWRAIITAARWLGYTAGYFADVPGFLKWLLDMALIAIAATAHEPIGSIALACAIGIILAWLISKRGPPIF